MQVVESGIDHSHDDSFPPGRAPGFGRADPVKPPEIAKGLVPTSLGPEKGVVGLTPGRGLAGPLVDLLGVIALGPGHVGVLGIEGQGEFRCNPVADSDAVDMGKIGQGWVSGRAGSREPRLARFGLERTLQSRALVRQGAAVGTPKQRPHAAHGGSGLEGIQ